MAMLNGVNSMSIFSLFGSCRNKCMYSKFVVNAVNLLVFFLCLLLLLKHTLHIGLSVFQWHRLTVIIAMNGIYLLLLICSRIVFYIALKCTDEANMWNERELNRNCRMQTVSKVVTDETLT